MDQTLTICLITKNEGLNIKPFLASFSNLTENFILVDTGSDDATISIAKNNGTEVHNFNWCDDFSKARNFCLSKVKTPWVMMVDADQRISDSGMESLKKCFSTKHPNTDVFYLRCEFNNRSIYLPKIWRSELNLNYLYPVHEYLDFQEKKIRATQCEAAIENTTKSDYTESREKYISIMEKYTEMQGDSAHILYYLVSDNSYLGNWQKVLHWAARYLANNPHDDAETSRVLVKSAKALIQTDNPAEAREVLSKTIQFDPQNAEGYLMLGELFHQEGEIEKAKRYYEEITNGKFTENPNFYSDFQSIKQQAAARLSLLT